MIDEKERKGEYVDAPAAGHSRTPDGWADDIERKADFVRHDTHSGDRSLCRCHCLYCVTGIQSAHGQTVSPKKVPLGNAECRRILFDLADLQFVVLGYYIFRSPGPFPLGDRRWTIGQYAGA